jgi:hypothetical protein
MNPFRKAAREARNPDSRNYSPALAKRIETEGKIANALVKAALASGYVVSVYDGEEWALKFSANRAEIMDAMFSTDGDVIAISAGPAGERKRIGTVTLIYGNSGYDVISDYGAADLDAFSAWIKPVEDYAGTLEN